MGNSCNYECEYCPPQLHNGSKPWLSKEQYIDAINKFSLYYNGLGKRVDYELIGGEVTVIPGFEDIPTAKEQGIDVVAVNWRGLYTPKGASEASYKKWTEALRKVGDSPEWAKTMKERGLAPFNKVGGNFQSYVDQVIGEVRTLSKEIGVIQ